MLMPSSSTTLLERFPDGFRPIMVGNGSVDGSSSVARSLGAVVIAEPRRGFGAACHAGLSAAVTEVVCFCDCDASLIPASFHRSPDRSWTARPI